jgi:hypothetical protein
VVEHVLGKDGVGSSILLGSTTIFLKNHWKCIGAGLTVLHDANGMFPCASNATYVWSSPGSNRERMLLVMRSREQSPGGDPEHSPERRTLLRWLGAASLILPIALAACGNSVPPRQIMRPRSHITGKDHRNGGV